MRFLDTFVFSLVVLLSLKWARSFYYLGEEELAVYMLSLVILYFVITISFKKKGRFYLKSLIVIVTVLILVLIPTVQLIKIADKTPTISVIHDCPLQIEEAINFLLNGKTPIEKITKELLLLIGIKVFKTLKQELEIPRFTILFICPLK